MFDFPTFKTGCIIQYPTERSVHYSTGVVQFLDGSEQRFRRYQQPLKRWCVRLSQLDETEMTTLETFVDNIQKNASVFRFTDPWSGITHERCRLEQDEFLTQYEAPLNGQTNLLISEEPV